MMDAEDSYAETSGSCGENLTWSIDGEGNLTITGTGEMTGYGYNAVRWGGNTVKTVSFPNGLTTIGMQAFRDCTSLTSVTIPDSVTSIENSAFYGCTSLTSVTIPDSVMSIEGHAFRGCTSLASVTIPDSVTSIGFYAFYGCTSLTSVTIPDSVTSIGDYAFLECTSMVSATIGNSVTSIGDEVFSGCTSLTSLTVGESNIAYSSENGVLFNKTKTELIQYPIGKTDNSYTIPVSITSIGTRAFYGCTSLASVIIGNSVTSIGDDAFKGCTSLESITVAGSNTTYSSENGVLFNKAKTRLIQYPAGKTSVSYTLPDSVTSIESYAFYGCTSLASVTIPDSVTSIEGHAFRECTSLASVTIPDSVTIIEPYTFYGCTSLASVTIPDSVTSIKSDAFYNCTSLTEVNVTCTNLLGITKGAGENGYVAYYATAVNLLHPYTATYGWADDGSSCTVHIVCANDAAHNHDIVAEVASSVKIQPTATTKGTTEYSVSGTYDGFAYSDTKDVQDIPVTDGSSSEIPITYAAIGGGVAVLALAGVAFFLIRRR